MWTGHCVAMLDLHSTFHSSQNGQFGTAIDLPEASSWLRTTLLSFLSCSLFTSDKHDIRQLLMLMLHSLVQTSHPAVVLHSLAECAKAKSLPPLRSYSPVARKSSDGIAQSHSSVILYLNDTRHSLSALNLQNRPAAGEVGSVTSYGVLEERAPLQSKPER